MPAEVDKKTIVYFGGQYVPLAEARVGILTHAELRSARAG